jgi:peroxiredoxin
MERSTGSQKFPLGSVIPSFTLPNVDGSSVGDRYLRDGTMALVVFTCNHCPYVKGSEAFLIELVEQYQSKGLRAVAISSNDAVQYPDDGLDAMKVKAREMKLPYPYLYDESQQVAKAFDAACTPECYLFDSAHTLAFHGAINDSPKNPSAVSNGFLARALQQLSQGLRPEPQFAHPIGCSIKWRAV